MTMRIYEPILARLAVLERAVRDRPRTEWGTVTGVSPLEVTLDGQDAALFCSNATGASIPAGRRVFVSIDRGAATVIGRAP